jgi:hypothetical protein
MRHRRLTSVNNRGDQSDLDPTEPTMYRPSLIRTRALPAALLVSAVLLACAACSVGGAPSTSTAGGTGTSGTNDTSSAANDSGGSGSPDTSGGGASGTSTVGSGDAAGSPFCTDLVSAPSGSSDDSDAAQLAATVDFWQKVADEAPADIKPTVSAVADGFRKVANGDLSASSDQSWVDNVTGVSTWFLAHC